MRNKILVALIVLMPVTAYALPPYFNFDGTLLNTSDVPITTATTVTFGIYDPSQSCLLYEETKSITPDTNGNFSYQVGTGTLTGSSPGLNWTTMFQSTGLLRGPGSGNCTPGYTAATGDGRLLVVSIGGVPMTPAFKIAPVPMATVADSLSPGSKINGDLTLASSGRLLLGNTTSTIGLFAPTTLSSSYNLSLPNLAPTTNQVLVSDGSGGSNWQPLPLPFNPTAFNSAFTGTSNSLLVNSGSSWSPLSAPSTNGQVLTYNGSTLAWQPVNSTFSSAVTSTGVMTGASFTSTNNGSPSIPSYTSTLDTTSGVYFPSSGMVGFSTAGTERMRVVSNGNVGIGTTFPNASLDVERNSGGGVALFYNNMTNPGQPVVQMGGASSTSAILVLTNTDSASSSNGPALQIGVSGTPIRSVQMITVNGTGASGCSSLTAGIVFSCSFSTGGATMPSGATAFYQCFNNGTPSFTATGFGTGSTGFAMSGIASVSGSMTGASTIKCKVEMF